MRGVRGVRDADRSVGHLGDEPLSCGGRLDALRRLGECSTSMTRVAAWILACCLAFAWVAGARAQDVSTATGLADDEAHARFEAGRVALAAGRNEAALENFTAAYELSRRPELLYNIAIAADRLRRDDVALDAFERYLAAMPADQVQNRAEVESRVTALRAAHAAASQSALASSSPSSVHPEELAIPLLVGGGVGVAAGALLLGLGLADRTSVESAPTDAAWASYADAAARAPFLEWAGGLALGLGVVALTAGIVVLTLPPGIGARVALRSSGAGLAVEGTF